MKKIFASALLALGIISAANATDYSHFGTTNVVYLTGSTAFRAVLFNAITNTSASVTNASGTYVGVFDSGTSVTLLGAKGAAVTGSTSLYNAYGTVSGNPTIISVSLTGSEAGIGALTAQTINQNIKVATKASANFLGYTNASAALPGTPTPAGSSTGYLDPADGTGNTRLAVDGTFRPDLAFADTSKAVSLSSGTSVIDLGIVGVVPFTWAKGADSAQTNANWTHLTNVTEPQLVYALGALKPVSFFTGNTSDTQKVYIFGRNKGSGTRVNTLLDLYYGVTVNVIQYALNCYYTSGGVLTYGTNATAGLAPTTLSTQPSSTTALVTVGNDGFDGGSGVTACLTNDYAHAPFVAIGYVGISDFQGVTNKGVTGLTLNGVAANDGNVISGAYPFWGHEHVYAVPTLSYSSTAGIVATRLTGTSGTQAANTGLGSSYSNAAGSALETALQNAAASIGGGHYGSSYQSVVIDPAVMLVDKAGDTGYPTP